MILVTGGSGFIGKYVVKLLCESGEKTVVLVRNREKYVSIGDEIIIQGDLSDKEWIDNAVELEIDTCIHLAWEGIPDYSYEVSEKNLIIGLNILRLCRELNIDNLVISGSCWEYDNPEGSIRTNHSVQYNDAFKAAKNSLHMMASSFCREYGIHLNWLRLFYVYGSGQRKGSLIPYIIDSFNRNQIPELNGAYNKNDFVYVEDVAEAIVRVAKNHVYPETINVGSGKPIRVLDIVNNVANRYGFNKLETFYPISKGKCFYADKEEMKEAFGWSAKTEINDGITKMINI